MGKWWSRIKKWYKGGLETDPNQSGARLRLVRERNKRPALARAIDRLGRFWLSYWQWIITILVAVIAILVMISAE